MTAFVVPDERGRPEVHTIQPTVLKANNLRILEDPSIAIFFYSRNLALRAVDCD
jgi:hypothetical protein